MNTYYNNVANDNVDVDWVQETEEYFEMKVESQGQTDLFDVKWVTSRGTSRRLIISPGQTRTKEGCMVMLFEDSPEAKEIVIDFVTWNPKCAKSGNLERKYGTRRMLLGALLCVIELVKEKGMNHLSEFVLADEATYSCPPLSKTVFSFVSDIFVIGETYYARHLKMQPVLGSVTRSKKLKCCRKCHDTIATLAYLLPFL